MSVNKNVRMKRVEHFVPCTVDSICDEDGDSVWKLAFSCANWQPKFIYGEEQLGSLINEHVIILSKSRSASTGILVY